jgi:hypothetical protein
MLTHVDSNASSGVVGWLSFRWLTIHETHGKLLSVKNPAATQFLTQTCAPGTYYHTPFKEARLAHSPFKWHTYTVHVARLKNPSSVLI